MARTTSRGSRPMIRASRTDGFEIITAPAVHPAARLLGLLVRLRAELTALAGFLLLCGFLTLWLTAPGVLAVLAVALAVVLAVPPVRRFVSRRGAAVMTRHRLRQVLIERRCLNFSRHAPLFLWSHPTEVGDTVWLLLRAGISPSDVESECEWIASGCLARDARVTPVRRLTAIVKVEVIRRDPLATELIASELADWTATAGQAPPRSARVVPPTLGNAHWSGTATRTTTVAGSGASVPVPRPTLDESDDVPLVVDHQPAPADHAAKTDAPEDSRPRDAHDPVSAGAPAGRGGDWSDYV